jgi:hypothetical protein
LPLFGRLKRSGRDQAPPPPPSSDDVNSHEFALKLSYNAKSSEAVRLKAGPELVQRLHSMLVGNLEGESELIEPLPVALGQASPFIARMPGSAQWLQYHHKRSPVTRHTLVVLESVDAIDPVYETLVCGLLSGETDTLGYPEYDAIVRGDTDRNAAGILAGLFNNIAGDSHAIGTVNLDRAAPASGPGGMACAHCGFNSGHEIAFYCPKCGMRMSRG